MAPAKLKVISSSLVQSAVLAAVVRVRCSYRVYFFYTAYGIVWSLNAVILLFYLGCMCKRITLQFGSWQMKVSVEKSHE